MLKYLLLIITIFIFHVCLYSQQIISGKITDSKSGENLDEVHIVIPNTGLGMVSNKDGAFRLSIPPGDKSKSVKFSRIGYESKTVLLKNWTNGTSISLIAGNYELQAAVIAPDNTLRNLLRNAYEKIPENYPSQATRYEGFHREVLQDKESGQYLYFVEAILDIFKNSYTKTSDFGQVKVLKTRSYKMPLSIADSINNIYFYGASFFSISKDYVLQRGEFINPANYKSYRYRMRGLSSFDDKIAYEIAFKRKESRIDTIVDESWSKMYIDTISLAYIAFDIKLQDTKSTLRPINYENRIEKLRYAQHQSKWYLLSISYIGEKFNRNKGKRMYSDTEYITTHINFDSVQTIPFSEQLNYFQPLSLIADVPDSTWNDYNILTDDSTKTQFKYSIAEAKDVFALQSPNTISKRKSFIEKIFPHLLKLDVGVGLSYSQTQDLNGTYALNFQPTPKSEALLISKKIKNTKPIIALNLSAGYNINRYWRVFWSTDIDLFNKSLDYNRDQLGVEYSVYLNKKGKPLTLRSGLSYSWSSYWVNLGTHANTWGNFNTNGKNFDTEKLAYSFGLKSSSITPSLSLRKQLSRMFTLDVFAQYDIYTSSSYKLRMKEKSGFFLSRKSLSSKNIDGMELQKNNTPITTNYFKVNRLNFGIRLFFK